jgi:hypothetical protein
MKFQEGLFRGCVYVGMTGTFADSVRWACAALLPVEFLILPIDVSVHVEVPLVCARVPYHSTVPRS